MTKMKPIKLSDDLIKRIEALPDRYDGRYYSETSEEILRRYYPIKTTKTLAEIISEIEGRKISSVAIAKKARDLGLQKKRKVSQHPPKEKNRER